MPFEMLKQDRPTEVINRYSPVKLVSYSGNTMGETLLDCHISGSVHKLKFHIIDKPAKPLIGLHDSLRLGLITLCNIHAHDSTTPPLQRPPTTNATEQFVLRHFKDLFDNQLGKLPVEYRIKVDQEVKPVIRSPRHIPVAMQGKVKSEIDRMVQIGVITPVTKPTKWVSSMVAANKKNTDEIQIRIDLCDLNEAIQRQHYPMRTVDEIDARMPNAKYFTVLDASSGFWQIPSS